jgi:amino acid permease
MRGPKFLIEVADDLSADNILYSDVARVTLGGKWPIFSDILLIIGQVGICVAYLIFLTEFSQIQA